MIRLAEAKDLNGIMDIIKDTINEMKEENNIQWDETYPKREDFLKDIENKTLYVNEERHNIRGFICIDKNQPEAYKLLQWQGQDKEFMVIHRMAVGKNYRNQGLGKILFEFAEKIALENNIHFLRSDTYSLNYKMRSLFRKEKFKFIGEADFGKEKKFYCYEKEIKM